MIRANFKRSKGIERDLPVKERNDDRIEKNETLEWEALRVFEIDHLPPPFVSGIYESKTVLGMGRDT